MRNTFKFISIGLSLLVLHQFKWYSLHDAGDPSHDTMVATDTPRPLRRFGLAKPGNEPVKVVCISDTHNKHSKWDIPPGEIFIHTGDFSNKGTEAEVTSFNQWLGTLPHPFKVVIAGNHEVSFPGRSRKEISAMLSNAIYVQDEEIEVMGVRIYGSPWSPHAWTAVINVVPSMMAGLFGRNVAYTHLRGSKELDAIWQAIPASVDILLTHSPPADILALDQGCELLKGHVLERVKPQIHIFGHVHSEGGKRKEQGGVLFVNAACAPRRFKKVDTHVQTLDIVPRA